MTGVRRSLFSRVIAAWRNPAVSWRSEWALGVAESRLVAIAFGAALFLTIGPVASEAIRPVLALGEERLPWFAARLLIGFSFLPLALYLVAALLGLICRAFGGRAPDGESPWKACRLALFWSALASGPIAAVVHALGGFAGLQSLATMVAGLIWIVLLVPMVAAAQGFAVSRVAAAAFVISAIAIAAPRIFV